MALVGFAFGENYFVLFINSIVLAASHPCTHTNAHALNDSLRAHVFFNSIASGDTIFLCLSTGRSGNYTFADRNYTAMTALATII